MNYPLCRTGQCWNELSTVSMMASAELSTVSMMASAENELSTVPQNASEIQGISTGYSDINAWYVFYFYLWHFSYNQEKRYFHIFPNKTDQSADSRYRRVRVSATACWRARLVRAPTPVSLLLSRIDTQFSTVGDCLNSHPPFCLPAADVGCTGCDGSAKANPLPFLAVPTFLSLTQMVI